MTQHTVSPPADSPSVRRDLWPWVVILLAIQLVFTLPVIFSSGAGNDFDEAHYHYPAVLQIREHWPSLDLDKDCLSPIAPGYHYFLATCSLLTGSSLIAMRLVTDALSLFIPVLLFVWLSHYVSAKTSFLYSLPLTLCCFFLKASCRVVTDNAALLLTLLTLMAVFLWPACGWRGTVAGVTTSLAIVTRQLTASLMAPALLQLVMERLRLFESDDSFSGETSASKRRWSDFLPALIFRLLPFAILGYLVHTWHGLVAPQWQSISMTLSAAPLAYALAVAGFLGSFFILTLGPIVTFRQWTDRWVITTGLGGLICSLASPTSWSSSQGRWGGWLWLLVHHLPSFGQRSVVFMILSSLGAALITLMTRLLWKQGQRRGALLWICSVAAWMSSYAVGTNIYHHYYEAPLMIFFTVACTQVFSHASGNCFRWWPLLLLIAYDLALSFSEIYGGVFLHLGLSDLPR